VFAAFIERGGDHDESGVAREEKDDEIDRSEPTTTLNE
jgi:hypothetical protein